MTEWEFLLAACLTICVVSALALAALVVFFWWAEDGEKDEYDPYQQWDKWDRE